MNIPAIKWAGRLLACLFLLVASTTVLHAQCDPIVDGPFTLLNQEPANCERYVGSMWSKQLPSDKMDFRTSDSSSVIAGMLGRDGFIVQFMTPGSADFNQVPVNYGVSGDPVRYIPLTSVCPFSCGIAGEPGYLGDPSQTAAVPAENAIGAIRLRIKDGARWTARSGNGQDSHIAGWDQVSGMRWSLYKSSGPANNQLPACAGTTDSTACQFPGGFQGQAMHFSRTGADVYRVENSGDTSLHEAVGALMVRHAELIAGEITHPISIVVRCERTNNVFPALPSANGQASKCLDTPAWVGYESTSFYHGQLIFLDYTDAEIDAMAGITNVHKIYLKALANYGGYVMDTSFQPLLTVQTFESLQSWYDEGIACDPTLTSTPSGTPCADNTPIATVRANVPIVDWLMDQGITCSVDNTTLCKMGIDIEATPLVNGLGIAGHMHVGEPCLAMGLAGLAGGCGTASSQPDHLSIVVQPTTAIVSTVISPAITVQIKDENDVNQSDSGVIITASFSPVAECGGVLGGDTTQATNASGLATFNDLTISIAGTCTLSFSATSITSATSNVFDITNAPDPTDPGTITIDGTPDSTESASNGTSQSHALTVGANSNRLLLACAVVDAGSLVSDQMYFNSTTAMTLVSRAYHGAGGVSVSMWYILAPTAGAATVHNDVGFSTRQVVGAISLYNVDQTNPFRDVDQVDSRSAVVSASTLTLTSVANDFLVGCLGAGRDTDPIDLVPGASFTQQYDNSISSSPTNARGAIATRTAGGSTVQSVWTWNNDASFGHIAASLRPVSDIIAVPVTTYKLNSAATFTWSTTIGGTVYFTYSLDGGTVWLPSASGITANNGTYTIPADDETGVAQQHESMKVCISTGPLCTGTIAPYGPFRMVSTKGVAAP